MIMMDVMAKMMAMGCSVWNGLKDLPLRISEGPWRGRCQLRAWQGEEI